MKSGLKKGLTGDDLDSYVDIFMYGFRSAALVEFLSGEVSLETVIAPFRHAGGGIPPVCEGAWNRQYSHTDISVRDQRTAAGCTLQKSPGIPRR